MHVYQGFPRLFKTYLLLFQRNCGSSLASPIHNYNSYKYVQADTQYLHNLITSFYFSQKKKQPHNKSKQSSSEYKSFEVQLLMSAIKTLEQNSSVICHFPLNSYSFMDHLPNSLAWILGCLENPNNIFFDNYKKK